MLLQRKLLPDTFDLAAPAGGTATDLYYSDQWQVIEEQQTTGESPQTTAQYVWSPVYVDAMVERDRDTDANGSLDERLYAQTDANYNVTALVDTSGTVVERYVYDPYGNVTVLNTDGTMRGDGTASASNYASIYLHQGGRFDTISGLYYFRNRDYSPTLGRWTEEDPAGYVDGLSLYQCCGGSPVGGEDPSGRTPYADEAIGATPTFGFLFGGTCQICIVHGNTATRLPFNASLRQQLKFDRCVATEKARFYSAALTGNVAAGSAACAALDACFITYW